MVTTPPDATDLANLVRYGQASPAELVEDAIARIEVIKPKINVEIYERLEAAGAEAAVATEGPSRGVAFLVKV